MRHKYDTRGIVLARTPVGEAHAELAILTSDIGLVFARAAGLRRSRSKLAHALVTFAESELTLVRGREGWRVAGALLTDNWFVRLAAPATRERATRVAGLLLRLNPGEEPDARPFALMTGFFAALAGGSNGESAELVAVESLLSLLGLAESAVPEAPGAFAPERLAEAARSRARIVARINRGIAASGL